MLWENPCNNVYYIIMHIRLNATNPRLSRSYVVVVYHRAVVVRLTVVRFE